MSNLFSNGQTTDQIAYKYFNTLNEIDSLGQRQGKWTYYRLIIWDREGISHTIRDTSYRIVSTGTYVNDRKTGTWVYYYDEGDAIWITRILDYRSDRSILEKIPNKSETEYSPDSLIVTSTIQVKQYLIYVECLKKESCFAKYQDHLLKQFDFEMFEFEKDWIAQGDYNRLIYEIEDMNSR